MATLPAGGVLADLRYIIVNTNLHTGTERCEDSFANWALSSTTSPQGHGMQWPSLLKWILFMQHVPQ